MKDILLRFLKLLLACTGLIYAIKYCSDSGDDRKAKNKNLVIASLCIFLANADIQLIKKG